MIYNIYDIYDIYDIYIEREYFNCVRIVYNSAALGGLGRRNLRP